MCENVVLFVLALEGVAALLGIVHHAMGIVEAVLLRRKKKEEDKR